uniref:Uncharacterized protein n=1 Tax=Amphimedon queenslandica TaxID=400682 RepID=A0A1X7VFL8_AMPQE
LITDVPSVLQTPAALNLMFFFSSLSMVCPRSSQNGILLAIADDENSNRK